MSQVTSNSNLSTITDTPTFIRMCSNVISEIVDYFNGQIEFDKNIKSKTITVSFPFANTDVAVNHNLNKIQVGYIPIVKDVPLHVVSGNGARTLNTIYLQCTVATNVTMIII